MLEIVLVLTSIGILAASILLYRHAAGDVALGKLNMLSYSFYILLIQAWFGAVIITVNLPFVVYDPAVFNRVIGNRGTQIELWAWIMWMFLGLPLGAILVNVFRRTGPMVDVMARYRASPLQIGPNERPLFTACVIVGTIILGLTGYRLATMGDLPIMNALRTDDVNETLLLRRNFRMSTGFGTEILSSVFSFTVIVWMSYVAYAVMSVTKLSRWRVLFCVTKELMLCMNWLVWVKTCKTICKFVASTK